MRRRVVVLLAPLVVAAAACGGDGDGAEDSVPASSVDSDDSTVPSTPPSSAPTETTAPPTSAPTETTAASTTTTSTPTTSTTTEPEAEPSAEAAAVLIGGGQGEHWLPAGGWTGSEWLALRFDTPPDALPIEPGQPAQVVGVGFDSALETAVGEPGEGCFDGRVGYAIDAPSTNPEPPGFGYSAIAVTAGWDVQPRPVTEAGLDVEEYRVVGAAFADSLGVDGSAGQVVQVVRVDLDGDGTEEVFVTFEHDQGAAFGAPGDYSITYLRAPSPDGEVIDTIVHSSLVRPDLPDDEMPFIGHARFMTAADLNGDGTMEAVLRTWYYEGAGASAYELVDQELDEIMSNGCGA